MSAALHLLGVGRVNGGKKSGKENELTFERQHRQMMSFQIKFLTVLRFSENWKVKKKKQGPSFSEGAFISSAVFSSELWRLGHCL